VSEHEQKGGSAGRQDYVELGYELLGQVRRASQRVALALPARCLFADCGEAPATIRDVSACGLALDCYRSGLVGEPVIVEIEHLDRFDGRIVRRLQTGFAVELRMTPYRRERLRLRLEALAAAERGVSSSRAAPTPASESGPAPSSA